MQLSRRQWNQNFDCSAVCWGQSFTSKVGTNLSLQPKECSRMGEKERRKIACQIQQKRVTKSWWTFTCWSKGRKHLKYFKFQELAIKSLLESKQLQDSPFFFWVGTLLKWDNFSGIGHLVPAWIQAVAGCPFSWSIVFLCLIFWANFFLS